MNIQDNLTDKTRGIYDSLKSKYLIELECNPELLGCHIQNWGMIQSCKIIAPNEISNQVAFAHELLHIQQFELGIVDSKIIRNIIEDYFSEEFIRRLNNNLAHLKMLPTFIDLGFDKRTFLHENLCELLNQSKERIINFSNEPNAELKREKFIWEYSIIKFLENFEELNTNDCMRILKEFDKKLFIVLDQSFSEWLTLFMSDNIKFFNKLKNRLVEIDELK